MSTKKRILDAALTLFSEKGYANVHVAQIAEAVGIKAPSLYKHYRSKQEIFSSILDEMKKSYDLRAGETGMNGSDAGADAAVFSAVSEDELVKMGLGLFGYFLHDEYTRKVRRMLTLEQYNDPDLAQLFTRQYVDDPLTYQGAMLAMLCAGGILEGTDAEVMALEFYAPINLMLTLCDRHPEREPEALALIERHIRQFSRLYGKGEKK